MIEGIQPITLRSEQIGALLKLVPAQKTSDSPLGEEVDGKPGRVSHEEVMMLSGKGWLSVETGKPLLTEAGNQALKALLAPKTVATVTLGNPRDMVLSQFYGADGFERDKLVQYAYRENMQEHVITPGLSPEDLSAAMLAHLMLGPRLEAFEFQESFPVKTALVLLGMLDMVQTRYLWGKLHNIVQPDLSFSAQELWTRMTEIWLGEDITWLSALVPFLIPYVDFYVQEEDVGQAVEQLNQRDYVDVLEDGSWQLSDWVIALAEAVSPMYSFGSCGISRIQEHREALHLIFIVGPGTNLVLEVTKAESGEFYIHFTGVNGVELSKLLFRFGLPEQS